MGRGLVVIVSNQANQVSKAKGNGHESSILSVLRVNSEGNAPATRSHPLVLQKLTCGKETTCSGQSPFLDPVLPLLHQPSPRMQQWNDWVFLHQDSPFKN